MGGPLSASEIAAFKRDGFIVKRQVMDPQLMAMARAAMWAELGQGIEEGEPSTWVGETSADGPRFRTGVGVGDKPWLVEMLPANPTVWGVAEQLLGRGVVVPPSKSIRSINANRAHSFLPQSIFLGCQFLERF